MSAIVTGYSDGRIEINGKPVGEAVSLAVAQEITQAHLVLDAEQVKPSAAELLQSAAQSAVSVVASGFKTVGDQEREARLAVCLQCPHLSTKSYCLHLRRPDGSIERGCGCYMPVKANFATMKCPVGKW